MHTPVKDIQLEREDTVAVAIAKQMVADGIKKEGKSRALLIEYFVEPQRSAERYRERDQSTLEADKMADFVRAIVDPHLNDAELDELLKKWARSSESILTLSDNPLEELPPLPKPPARRK